MYNIWLIHTYWSSGHAWIHACVVSNHQLQVSGIDQSVGHKRITCASWMPSYPPRGRSRRVVTIEDIMVLAQVKILSWYVTASDRSRETVGN